MKRSLTLTLSGILALSLFGTPAIGNEPDAREPYRPVYHYTPDENWMNDPNGLVYVDGVYHLYYQHNPQGSRWGNMSWGHATSTDLITWDEQPLAIPQTFNEDGLSVEDIFSGSIVVDADNTSGLGSAENPPLIAHYTSAYTDLHPTLPGIQAQSLAYSLDSGHTWHKYEGNPVLDRGSANFRDPKVFRYTSPEGGEQYWVMVVVEALDHQVLIYRSDDLIDWTYLSTFGPANATGGIWEVPDLFPLEVDDTGETKWVMIVNLNPGSPAGGSGAQYFVGEFDGVTFTAENLMTDDAVPSGTVLADFEFDSWEESGWTADNETDDTASGPFGDGPIAGEAPDQGDVSGYFGDRLVNSFVGGDWPVGTLTSPSFTINEPWLNLLVGGGNHPRVPGGQLGNEPPEGELLWNGFEVSEGQTLADFGWSGEGDFAATESPSDQGGDYYIGQWRLNTWEAGPHGDDNVGSMASPEFTIDGQHISMLVGGGREKDQTLQVQLLVGDQVVRSVTGRDAGDLAWETWDVGEFSGQPARIRVVDEATGGWGHLTLDHIVMGDEPAVPRSDETTVNLVVAGEVVHSATGKDSETLDWVSWDVSAWVGQEAEIVVIDNNRFGWGHILLDHVVASETAQARRVEAYDWLDWGQDYYAAISFSNMPDDRRVTLAWMNDWRYAESIPTSPWRSSMTLPREVTLTETETGYEVRQIPVRELDALQQLEKRLQLADIELTDQTVPLDWSSDSYKVTVTLDSGDAERTGIAVLASENYTELAGEATFVGIEAGDRLVVDRTRSGETDFHPDFAGVASAPITTGDGTVTFTAYVDRSSVEVFTQDGSRTITSQAFPSTDSLGLVLVSEGGTSTVLDIEAVPLSPEGDTAEPSESPSAPGSPEPSEPSSPAPGLPKTGWSKDR